MKSKTILTWIFVASISPAAVYAVGKHVPTPEELARAFQEQVHTADVIVIGTLSDIQPRRFEITFHGKDGGSQTNPFDSGTLQIQKVLKGADVRSDVVVAFRSKNPALKYYGVPGNEPRIWVLQATHEPVAGFHMLSSPSFPLEDEPKFLKALTQTK